MVHDTQNGNGLPRTLYPKSDGADLEPTLFRSPGSEYRAAPFWAWNNKLEPE